MTTTEKAHPQHEWTTTRPPKCRICGCRYARPTSTCEPSLREQLRAQTERADRAEAKLREMEGK